ncbi:hypothetical protein BDK51DRAFT_50159 [Blyttiomyces helicus]|uniref:Ankyrin repeat-containing domain protein n=1 Tax=Blyttiomyces helicus TaxID=388810 RepID=A0A4P9W4T4_9FUNG|nr:hypothetical protein BDK51DRAFT_50159 [Blyttiomyces helicus]|eukprot:RKO86932.1 hypothetical protein BDK51DRAFT_50159 [Blyttiomyces helicus]
MEIDWAAVGLHLERDVECSHQHWRGSVRGREQGRRCFGGGEEGGVSREAHVPKAVAVARDRWDAVWYLVGAGFSTKRAVDVACMFDAKLDRIWSLNSLGHDGMATAAAIHYAAFWNRVPLVRLLHSRGLAVVSGGLMVRTCTKKWCQMIACLIDIGAPVPDGIGDDAAKQDDVSFVTFLHEIAPPNLFTARAMDGAAESSLKIVRFLHESRSEGCTRQAMDGAAGAGRLDVVRFLYRHRSEGCTPQAMDSAAGAGHLDVVRFHEHRSEGCTQRAVDSAARSGRFNIVRFLRCHRSEGYTPQTIDSAAGAGHLDAMDDAAKAGRLDIVRFFHEHLSEGCTTAAMDEAVGSWSMHAYLAPSSSWDYYQVRVKPSKTLFSTFKKTAAKVALKIYTTFATTGLNLQIGCERRRATRGLSLFPTHDTRGVQPSMYGTHSVLRRSPPRCLPPHRLDMATSTYASALKLRNLYEAGFRFTDEYFLIALALRGCESDPSLAIGQDQVLGSKGARRSLVLTLTSPPSPLALP